MELFETSAALLLEKAAEYRAMAETALTQHTRDTLFKTATEYEALAAERET
jgi:hypothetical protein